MVLKICHTHALHSDQQTCASLISHLGEIQYIQQCNLGEMKTFHFLPSLTPTITTTLQFPDPASSMLLYTTFGWRNVTSALLHS